ncbi:MAG: hypothetical protein ACRDHF_14425 [Tepidiformaceae bacterium]
MGREELTALIAVLQDQLDQGQAGKAIGTWRIGFDKQRGAFVFDHCESEGYCEERPAIIAVDGRVIDPGGPLFE